MIKEVINIEKRIESGKGIRLINKVLINIKKERIKKLLSLFSLLLLLLLIINKVLKASFKSLIILSLKLIIYYL
jgi:hypothetical protein